MIPTDEMLEIQENYENGGYRELKECLEEFLKAHASEIPLRHEDIETAAKVYIIEHKVINLRLDMKDQMNEIEKEKWYRGERHEDDDLEVVCKEWVKKYGEAWRTHRTREIIYVFEREKERYVRLVK